MFISRAENFILSVRTRVLCGAINYLTLSIVSRTKFVAFRLSEQNDFSLFSFLILEDNWKSIKMPSIPNRIHLMSDGIERDIEVDLKQKN